MTATATQPTSASSTIWAIDATHTNVEFAVRHLMIATVKGRFADVQGTVSLDAVDLSKSRVDVTIQTASIDTREARRDEHLRSADFFNVDVYPTLTFRSRRVTDAAGDRFRLIGDLTIAGVTREVVLDVTSTGRARDPWGGERSAFQATTTIKRSEFGLTWNQALETGGVLVGDEIKIAIDAELVKAAISAPSKV